MRLRLHDMGKIGIPDAILLKPGKLTPEEYEMMQKHSVFGKRTFEPMSNDEWRAFQNAHVPGRDDHGRRNFALDHDGRQDRLDASREMGRHGYPLGLAGEEIPLAGRITAWPTSLTP